MDDQEQLDVTADEEILAAFRASTVAFARPEDPRPAPPVLTEEEVAESTRLAQKHPPPYKALVISRRAGRVRGVVPNRRTWSERRAYRQRRRPPVVHAPARRENAARPRERRARSSAAPTRGDPHQADEDPPSDPVTPSRGFLAAASVRMLARIRRRNAAMRLA